MTNTMKVGIVLGVVLVAVAAWTAESTSGKAAAANAPAATADSAKAATADTAKAAADTVRQFTVEELAKCDGKEGRPAYIAVDGAVYDIAKAKGWKNGEHQGFEAGRDVTKDMQKKSPHGVKPLTKLPKVGVLAKPAAAPVPAK